MYVCVYVCMYVTLKFYTEVLHQTLNPPAEPKTFSRIKVDLVLLKL